MLGFRFTEELRSGLVFTFTAELHRSFVLDLMQATKQFCFHILIADISEGFIKGSFYIHTWIH